MKFSKNDECLQNLSEVEPLLAYTLNGKQHIQQFLNEWEEQIEKEFDFESSEEFNQMINLIKPNAVNEAIKEVEYVLFELAKTLGKRELKNIKEVLTQPDQNYIDSEIDRLLKTMFEPFFRGLK